MNVKGRINSSGRGEAFDRGSFAHAHDGKLSNFSLQGIAIQGLTTKGYIIINALILI